MKQDPWRNLAKIYDIIFEPFLKPDRKKCLDLCPPRENISILEIGCGTGTLLSMYNRPGCKLFGVDPSPAMLEKARKKLGESAEFFQEDAAHMSFPDRMFDLIIMYLVLHEVPPELRPAVLLECKRVLKPNGSIYIGDYEFGPYSFPRGYYMRFVRKWAELTCGLEHYARYRDFKARGGLKPILDEVSLSVEARIEAHGVGVGYLVQAK